MTQTRPLYEIAEEIINEAHSYKKKKGKAPSWWYYASAYVEPMLTLRTINEMYFADTAHSVVSYALANLGTWRGEKARQIKAELKALL